MKYYCKGCKKSIWRASIKPTFDSFCGEKGKTMRLKRIESRNGPGVGLLAGNVAGLYGSP